jgi:C4-dicarboxylate-specific signal transduction histidine kinase
MVDPILIEQVLVNLLKNAAESIEQAHRRRRGAASNCAWCPSIEDQAGGGVLGARLRAGLAPEVMERLYEAFFSTKAEGMGIGLNLCRTIVESHQGRMQAENIYNGSEVVGCRFSFWIPLSGATTARRDPIQ